MTLIEVKDDYDFDDLMDKCWSGAIDTLQTIYDNNYEDEFMDFLVNYYCNEIPTLTEINDLLWFEDEYIFECIGLNPNEDDEDDDEFEDEEEDEDDEDEDEFED